MDTKMMIIELEANWTYIQARIDLIKTLRNIDIKQISDLQRYIEMQRNIAEAIALLEKRG
jgi:hypothetical protein